MVITDSPGPVIAWIEQRARAVANWNPESFWDWDKPHVFKEKRLQTKQSLPGCLQLNSRLVAGLVGSPLEQDRLSTDMYAQTMIQAAIVSMAQERRLLILQNLSIIYAALYDVFNSNYCRAGGDGFQNCLSKAFHSIATGLREGGLDRRHFGFLLRTTA